MKLTKKLKIAVNSSFHEALSDEWRRGKKCYDEIYSILDKLDKKKEYNNG